MKANGKPKATLGERFSTTEHTITSTVLANGSYRFIATSMDGETIPGTSGTLFTVTLKADALLAAGTKLSGVVKSIEFNTKDNQKLIFNEVPFFATINNVIVGDVNGDGEVDLSDAIMVTYYSLHVVPASFNADAADMNGDGEIDLSDAIIIIYKSLGVK